MLVQIPTRLWNWLSFSLTALTFRSSGQRAHLFTSAKMAKSKFDYVRYFEQPDSALPNTYIVVRLDGKGFKKFTKIHSFVKPNDKRGLDLMARCALEVMKEFTEITLAYGQSDEYSFVFRRDTEIYKRRTSKIMTNIVSLFASSYVFYFSDFLPGEKLMYPPTFDARIVLYPTDKNLRDYLSWRQADCHINNLYNTAFWALVQQGGLSTTAAEERLRSTLSSDKNEILYHEFNLNYNHESAQFRKGTVIIRSPKDHDNLITANNSDSPSSKGLGETLTEISNIDTTGVTLEPPSVPPSTELRASKEVMAAMRASTSLSLASLVLTNNKKTAHSIPTELRVLHVDLIQDEFWHTYPFILQAQ